MVHIPIWLKWLAVLVAAVVSYAGFLKFENLEIYLARRHWPITQGTITSSDITGDRALRPVIGYRYTVGDSTYTDTTNLNTPGFGNKRRRLEVAEAWVKEYPVGKTIPVRYDPQAPRMAYISITPPWTDFFVPGLGVFCAIVAGFLLVCPTLRKSG
jgi:hypothetical protein